MHPLGQGKLKDGLRLAPAVLANKRSEGEQTKIPREREIKERHMNRKSMIKTAALVLLALGALCSAYADDGGCSNRLIAWDYGFTIQGTKLGGPGFLGPQLGVAMTHFNVDGSFTQIDTITISGMVVSDFTHTPANGTYTLNRDCTGTYTINFTDGRPPVTVNFIVVKHGAEIDGVVTSVNGNQGIIAISAVGKRR
jgi:hypothetical protein